MAFLGYPRHLSRFVKLFLYHLYNLSTEYPH